MKIGVVVATEDALRSAFVVFRDDLGHCIDQHTALGHNGLKNALHYASQVDGLRVNQSSCAAT